MQSCSLGCTSTGCAQTDIAQNQIITLTFSEAVDPNSVDSTSIRFRTPDGDEPIGEFFVDGPRVQFVPTLSIQGGQTFFGFTNGETYTMTIPGGSDLPAVVRGISGRPFGQTLSCTLQSSLGIVDLNGVPPSATLISPTPQQLQSAPLTTIIELEFNELIDATPFLSGAQSPVDYSVRRTRPDGNGGFECDPISPPQQLGGSQSLSYDAARGVSILTFTPAQPLPGNVCVEISVTDGVTDLSGTSAQPQVFVFQTEVVPLANFEITEEFDDASQFDEEASAGEWGNGVLEFSQIGGDGRHGEFTLDIATETGQVVDGKQVYEINCDNTIIPGSSTSTGSPMAVTDGRFFFSKFVLLADYRLRFVGSVPPVITVAGRFDVLGDIEVDGRSITENHLGGLASGQNGAVGGIFGGNGGKGGDRCSGTTLAGPVNQGVAGGDVNVRAGHGYFGMTAGTGGRGSTVFPVSGLIGDLQFQTDPPATPIAYCMNAVAGGSGGGLYTAGGDGLVVGIYNGVNTVPNQSSLSGAPAAAGLAFPLFPYPAVSGLQDSSDHFLVGGAGGGGSASNATLAIAVNGSVSPASAWASGAGGGGGGGAMALRAGRELRLGPGGRLLARGGSAWDYIGVAASAQVAPAGAGSGGSIVLQSAGVAELSGTIDVSGGEGGLFDRTAGGGVGPVGGRVVIQGGDGGDGFVRFEMPTAPATTELVGMVPVATADNVGTLTEVDPLVAVRSKFYSTGLIFGPTFSHYEIYATVDGTPGVVFSDNPEVSAVEAGVGAPVRALFQAAQLEVTTLEVESLGPWRNSVRSSSGQIGIASDGFNGYRFMLQFDRTLATSVSIEKVVVVYQN